MAYGNQFLRFTWLLRIVGTDEIAVTDLNYTSAPGWTGAAAAFGEVANSAVAGNLIGYMATMLGAIGWADYSQLYGLKIAAVGTNGHYLTDPYEQDLATPDSGTQRQVPPQSTVVLSLRSGFGLGPGNYGRMYLPHTQPSLGANTPYIPAAAQTSIAGYGKTFVNATTGALNAAATPLLYPAIMSQAEFPANSGGGQRFRGVTSVGCGRLVDTQRRRRNKLTEETVLVTLA